ncbi:hypothetical protein F5884DRAFT_745025 [Xylogone sp. PMI_703]|nr:hypothetical protein F5884DRAFT_745025 [Xylogone sp. PMI_703]
MRFSTTSVMTSLVAALAVQAVPMASVGSGALAARSATHQARTIQFSNSVEQIQAIATLLEVNGFSGSSIQNLLLGLGFNQQEFININFNDQSLLNQFGSVFNNNVWFELLQALSSSNIDVLQIINVIESSNNDLSALFSQSQNVVILEQLVQQNSINIFGNVLNGFSEQDLILLIADLVGGDVGILQQDIQIIQSGGIGGLSSVNLCSNIGNGNNGNNNGGSVGGSNSTVPAVKNRKH